MTLANETGPARGPRVEIFYCTQCNWLLRSAWLAQELLQTFGQDLGEVALRPGTGGAFRILYEGDEIWERVRDGGFPEAKILKGRVRDRLDPERSLGHSDRRGRRDGAAPDESPERPERSDPYQSRTT